MTQTKIILVAAKKAAPKKKKAAKKAPARSKSGNNKELAKFLRDKKAGINQRQVFLTAAVWLGKKGKSKFQTVEVTRAINSSGAKRLINPSQSLGQNLKMGLIRKSGIGQYVVTPKGAAMVKR